MAPTIVAVTAEIAAPHPAIANGKAEPADEIAAAVPAIAAVTPKSTAPTLAKVIPPCVAACLLTSSIMYVLLYAPVNCSFSFALIFLF